MYTMVVSKDSTTLRLKNKTKNQLKQLDFVQKHSFDDILNYLINFYKRGGK